MFAIALWDAPRGRLVVARDRFGIKPLYYAEAGGTLSFASELKALLRQPDFSREVDLEALQAFLAFNSIPAPLHDFAGARKLPAGPRPDLGGGRARAWSATPAPPRSRSPSSGTSPRGCWPRSCSRPSATASART